VSELTGLLDRRPVDDRAASDLSCGRLPHEAGASFASDRASFVSGVVIPVDGGWAARLA
jgi:hypothetical protein